MPSAGASLHDCVRGRIEESPPRTGAQPARTAAGVGDAGAKEAQGEIGLRCSRRKFAPQHPAKSNAEARVDDVSGRASASEPLGIVASIEAKAAALMEMVTIGTAPGGRHPGLYASPNVAGPATAGERVVGK